MTNSSESVTSKSPEQTVLERYFEHAFALYRGDEYVTLGFTEERVDQKFLNEIESLVPSANFKFRENVVKDLGIIAVQRGQFPAIAEVEGLHPALTNAVKEYVRNMDKTAAKACVGA